MTVCKNHFTESKIQRKRLYVVSLEANQVEKTFKDSMVCPVTSTFAQHSNFFILAFNCLSERAVAVHSARCYGTSNSAVASSLTKDITPRQKVVLANGVCKRLWLVLAMGDIAKVRRQSGPTLDFIMLFVLLPLVLCLPWLKSAGTALMNP